MTQSAEHEITIPVPEPKEVTNVVERPEQAIPHVVDHEQRLTRMEEKQAHDVETLMQQIAETREEFTTAIESARTEQAAMLEGKLTSLQEQLTRMETATVEVPQSVADDIEQTGADVVNVVPTAEPHKEPATHKGLRERRKERRERAHGNN